MLRKTVSGIMLTLLLTSMLALAFNIQPVKAGIIIVPDDYPTIQEAINAASPGSIVYVRAGQYIENVVINKTILLLGENKTNTVINGNETGTVLTIITNNVVVKGFTLTKSGLNSTRSGIFIQNCINITVQDNNVTNNYYGIFIIESKNSTITENFVSKNQKDGIFVTKSFNNTIIANNVIANSERGLFLQSSSCNILRNNTISGNHYNFGVDGNELSNFLNDVDASNEINGKPVYYWINKSQLSVPSDAGYVALVNCINITAQNLNLEKNYEGIVLINTSSSEITCNTIWGNTYGVYLRLSSGNDISGNAIDWSNWAVYLYNSSNNIVTNNTFTANGAGVFVGSANNNTISINDLTSTVSVGIALHFSSNCNVVGNNITSQIGSCICIDHSSHNSLCNNNLLHGVYGLNIQGSMLTHFLHSIDTSNMIRGKPVYYLTNQSDLTINPYNYSQIGYLALINSTNVTIANLTLEGNGQGLLLANTNSSKVINCTLKYNREGLKLVESRNNLLTNNTLTNNWSPVRVFYSSNNTLQKNFIKGMERKGFGISLEHSFNNTIAGNDIGNTDGGVILWSSSMNQIATNNVINNDYGIVLYQSSHNNFIINNNITNGGVGISIYHSFNNTIAGNNILANNGGGIGLAYSSYNLLIENNIVLNKGCGISLARSDNNEIYHNNFINNTQQAWPHESTNTIWDDGYPSGGNYWNDYNGTDSYNGPHQNVTGSDGIGDSTYVIRAYNGGPYLDRYPLMAPWPSHDVAIINVKATEFFVKPGDSLTVNLTIINQGDFLESFNLTLHANTSIIETQIVTNLPIRTLTILTFNWNTTGVVGGNYTLSAYASHVSGEIDTTDNTYLDGVITISTIPPVANFAWSPHIPKVGELITFDASASTPNGGTIVKYEWNFGDGEKATGKIVTHIYSDAGTFTVTLNVTDSEGLWDIEQKQIEVKAPPPPLTVSISPTSASILVGESITFTSTVSGGYTPYSYQWYLNGNPVSGATSDTWTFAPTESGIYYVYLKVTDDKGNTAQSETARITVSAVPVGGYSYPINKYTLSTPIATHIALMAILTAIFITIKRKAKRKH